MLDETYGDLFSDEVVIAEVPRRSRLYNLPMAGDIEGGHESLLSYLHRLARRHQVSIKDLMVKIVLPETSIQGVPCSYRFTSEYARSINGYGKYATELHRVLTALTQVPHLDRGNFLSWRLLFDGKGAGLLHATRRWCPCCLAEASSSLNDGYAHPLLWACTVVTHCPMHGCELTDTCLKCHAKQAQIADSFTFGRCGCCGAFLGWKAGLFEAGHLSERQLFVAKAVRQMIAANGQAANIGRPENFAAGLRCVAMKTHNGVVTQLARAIEIDYKAMSQWVNLEKRPRFDSFIEICYRLGAMPVDLLSATADDLAPQLRPGSQPLKRTFHKLTSEQLKHAKESIAKLVAVDDQYISAKQFAAGLGTTVGHLRYQLPQEYRQLVEHRLRVKAGETQRRLVERVALAQAVALELAEGGKYVPARKLISALKAKGLSILCPHVRAAAKGELQRLRREPLPRKPSSEGIT